MYIKDFRTQSPTEKCIMHQRKVDQYQVSIVDTPGWSSSSLESAVHILQSTSLCPPGPHAFILVLSARESFTNEDQQTLEALMKKFEDKVWRHTLLLFSHGSWLKDRSIEEYIECEGNGLEWLLNKCEGRYHVLDNYDWGDKSQVKDLLEKINEMVVRNRGQHFIPKQKKGLNIQDLFQRPKLLTEEEWRQKEDELIQRMFKAFWRNIDAEVSGDTMWESGSDVTIRPHRKVSKWLRESQHCTRASSSGYGTESTDFLIPHQRRAGSKDGAFIPSLSGETASETEMNPHSESGIDAGSSGYDTESISMGNNDILELRHAVLNKQMGYDQDKENYSKPTVRTAQRDKREQNRLRRNSC
ncbi:GTPase IMAP family member 4 [Trichomycterus rosablanca]|uniref:GTPase IMAP family member 4 n=1 Tax=Trichomycterus rosablanca TaxID=2290929 RepID=UPI002F35C4BC